jgi:cytochrome c biogenesis protein CcmG/thiol:disulfide interchange protein DsbE
MAKNSEANMNHWVDEHLAILSPDNEWQPNVARGLARLRERRGSNRGRSWSWMAAVTMASVAAVYVCLVALPAPRAFAQRCLDCSVAVWQSLTTASGAVVVRTDVKPEAERKMAPDFTLNDASGNPVKLSDFKGKVVVLNFWATWCHGCKTEIPWFIEFQKAYGDHDFAVLGVALDDDGWNSVKPYVKEKNVNYPVVVGSMQICDLFGGSHGLPMTFLIDKSGRIASRHDGVVDREGFKREIEGLRSEKAGS